MGFQQRKHYIWLNVANGFFVNKKENIKEFAWEGRLLEIKRVQDDYEERPIEKIQVKMIDEATDEIACIKFTDETWYAFGFFTRIMGVDLKRPFTIGIMGSDENEKLSFCWMKQGERKILPDKNFPQPKKTKKGADWSGVTPKVNEVIAHLQKELEQHAPFDDSEVPEKKQAVDSEPSTPVEDDLPF